MAAPHTLPDLDEQKRVARARAMAVRAGHDAVACGEALTAHVLRECPPSAGAVVSGFWPLGEEIDIRPLLTALHARGHRIALPVTPRRGQALSFRHWTPGCTMIPERFGTQRPDGPELVPSVLFVPLLAFDRLGHRLGYGAGYYDRTLAALADHTAIGCAFAAQEMDTVPVGPYDVPLHAIATERGVIRVGER